MNLFDQIRNSTFFIKVTRWEYWPAWLFNIPVGMIWTWFSIRAGHPVFFSAVNPAIETGGMLDESKDEILTKFPVKYIPVTVLVGKEDFSRESVLSAMEEAGLEFPLVLKPNTGERGKRVEKIDNTEELDRYMQGEGFDLIVQEYVDLPHEISVLYHRFPGEDKGAISSICLKEKLNVTGDGVSNMRELLRSEPRARFQMQRLIESGRVDPDAVPSAGMKIELEPIGNHCRGTKFLDGSHLASEELVAVFDDIMRGVEGLHYGRFDLKYKSLDSLKKGEGFRILEFNGAASEPAHVYDPRNSLFYAYGQYYKHWKIMYRIYRRQRAMGHRPISLGKALVHLRNHFRHQRQLST